MARPNMPGDDTKSFYSWFSHQAARQERSPVAGYPAVRIFPVYGKRFITGKTLAAVIAGMTLYGTWCHIEKERYTIEMMTETYERHGAYLQYQQSEANMRTLVSWYKRHRYEQDLLIDKGHVGLTTEFRKFFFHDDVFRPDLHDCFQHPQMKFGGMGTSYNWMMGYW